MCKTFLLSFLAIFSLSNHLSSQTFYVDSTAAPGGDGSITTPYMSLSYAITTESGLAGSGAPLVFWVAGRGAANPYTFNSLLPVDQTETFPMELPDGTRVRYWDVNGTLPVRPPSAVFTAGPVPGGTCFEMLEVNTGSNMTGITGYLPVVPLTLPDTNQGFELRDFEVGIQIEDNVPLQPGTTDFLVDGVAFYECRQAVRVRVSESIGSRALLRRCLMRSPSVSFPSDRPQIDLEFTDAAGSGAHTYRFSVESSDLRPSDSDTITSMMAFQGYDAQADDTLIVNLRNIEISGRSSTIPIIPPFTQQAIGGAGIEVSIRQGVQGRFNLEGVSVRDALGEGFYGVVMQNDSAGFLDCTNSSFRFNGSAAGGNSYLPVSQLGQSGLHLQVLEEGAWTVDEGRESHFDDNYRHGVWLDSGSFDDEADGFPLAEFDLCTFLRNGLDLDNSVRGHGIYTHMLESNIELHVHRSAASANHTSGINMVFSTSGPSRQQRLIVTNSTVSQNLGIGPPMYMSTGALAKETNPITVISTDESNVLLMNLSHVTVSDNPTPYALSLYGSTSLAQTSLWPAMSGSRIDNSVLNENGFSSSGGSVSDLAYYPEPPPIGSMGQWNDIFAGTDYSNLGRLQSGSILPQYTTAQFNYYDPPLLGSFTFMGNLLGDVFPTTSSPVIGKGLNVPFATEITDNRGPGFLRTVAPGRDTGAFEVQ
ncbi:MAG: hypothetical protein QM477_08935 [Planctomycetota bacterium]